MQQTHPAPFWLAMWNVFILGSVVVGTVLLLLVLASLAYFG
jgi:hypothetical protein